MHVRACLHIYIYIYIYMYLSLSLSPCVYVFVCWFGEFDSDLSLHLSLSLSLSFSLSPCVYVFVCWFGEFDSDLSLQSMDFVMFWPLWQTLPWAVKVQDSDVALGPGGPCFGLNCITGLPAVVVNQVRQHVFQQRSISCLCLNMIAHSSSCICKLP